MPKPIFIICSSSASTDVETRFLSVFQIIEKFLLSEIPPPPTDDQKILLVRANPIFVFATWMIEQGDSHEDDFEHELQFLAPGTGELIAGAQNTFRFSRPDERKSFQRFSGRFEMPPMLKDEGILWVVSRVRKAGETEWIKQEYPIIVEKRDHSAPPSTDQLPT